MVHVRCSCAIISIGYESFHLTILVSQRPEPHTDSSSSPETHRRPSSDGMTRVPRDLVTQMLRSTVNNRASHPSGQLTPASSRVCFSTGSVMSAVLPLPFLLLTSVMGFQFCWSCGDFQLSGLSSCLSSMNLTCHTIS